MIEEYRKAADGVTNLMIEELNPERMDYYIEENYSSSEYMNILKYFYKLKDNYSDVYYMYVYRFYVDSDGVPSGTIIIDLDEEFQDPPSQTSIEWVGGTYVVLEPFASKIAELMESREPVFETAFSESDGYLLSFAKPIFDENGNYAASACVDFSMESLHRQNIRFILIFSLILIIAGLLILLLFNIGLRRSITKPLLSISDVVSSFKYDTETDLINNLNSLKSLRLNSSNEIGLLYNALVTSEKGSLFYMNNYKKAEDEIHTKDIKINELGNLALRDALTNVGNKTAFDASLSKIKASEEYSIVLMDINNLKMINDTYGHEAGDTYIRGTCGVLCDVYLHSPVFRIGGDEFAVILKDRDYANRYSLMKNITSVFEKIWKEKEYDPVHRYSASLGMADSKDSDGIKETVKAADEAMYANKKAFKETNGSYR